MVRGNALSLPVAVGTVQTCVTSPPYWGLRDYGVSGQLGLESTPDAYVASMVAVFREVWRVLREDGTLWLNLGDSYASQGGPEPAQTKWQVQGASDGQNGGRSRTAGSLKPKDLVGIPWRVAFALQADGWYLRSDIIWAKPNPMPESVTDRPTKAHEYLFLLTKNARYYWDADAVREPVAEASVARAEYRGANGTKWSDAAGYGDNEAEFGVKRRACLEHGPANNPLGRNIRSVWTIATQPYPEAHFATFPEKLVEPCILAGSRPGDLVLDPFAGSGTVGVVSRKLARRFVGVELNAAYCQLARARMAGTQPGLGL